MAIQFQGAGAATFAATSQASILDGIHTCLTSAGWTDLSRFRAQATFRNLPLHSNPSNGETAKLGGFQYTFVTAPPVCPQVAIDVTDGGTMFNWSVQVNACDPTFMSPFGGQLRTPTDSLAPSAMIAVARNVGTAANDLVNFTDSANFGRWDNNRTAGGGWECESVATPHGLKLRVQLIGEYVGGSVLPTIRFTTPTEDVVSDPIRLNIGNFVYSMVANAFQFFIWVSGSTDVGTAASGGAPYLPTFHRPLTIVSATTALNAPITCNTGVPHNLVTGQQITILEAKETVNVSGSTTTNFFDALGNIFLQCVNAYQNGDVISYLSGTMAPQDGYYSINNVDPLHGFALLNTVGTGGLAGNVVGPAHSINGFWTVTVIDALNFTLNGSSGTGFTYVGSTALMATQGHLARCIWGVGSTATRNFRRGLQSSDNAQFIALNLVSYGRVPVNDPASPTLCMPGLIANPLNYSNGCSTISEPMLAVGANGAGSQAVVVGQLWDSAIMANAFGLDLTANLDGHTISAYSNQQGDPFPNFPLTYQGGLWIRTV